MSQFNTPSKGTELSALEAFRVRRNLLDDIWREIRLEADSRTILSYYKTYARAHRILNKKLRFILAVNINEVKAEVLELCQNH